jgi:hypothetical protein
MLFKERSAFNSFVSDTLGFHSELSFPKLTFNSFVSDTVSLGLNLLGCYLFVSVLCESVFV